VAEELVEVRLVGVPLDIHRRAGEHSAEVMREFAHLVEGPTVSEAPARLVVVDRFLQQQYQRFSQSTSEEIEAAIARGASEIDVTFTVPRDAGSASEAFLVLWQEVDEYCAEGRYLLALRSPPEVAAYRRWVTGEFVRQTAGEPPLSWRAWLDQSGGS
jgi:hypothetical protein